MLFNSWVFALFLPATFCIYWWLKPHGVRAQNLFLLAASYVFYGWWDYRFLSLIAISSTVDYLVGLTGNPDVETEGEYVPPELVDAVQEIQEIWRRVYRADPEAARELTRIAVIQGKAFETAVNAALRRLEGEEQEN